MKKIIIHPYIPANYLKTEDWLYAMSKKGYFLQSKFLIFFVFQCLAPQPTSFFWCQCFQRGDYGFFAEAQTVLGNQLYAIKDIRVPCFAIEPTISSLIQLKYKKRRNIKYQKRYKSLGIIHFVISLFILIYCLSKKSVTGYYLVVMFICFTIYDFFSLFIVKKEAKKLSTNNH